MGSRTKTRLNEAKKLAKEARFVFGHTESNLEQLRRQLRSWLEDIQPEDHHLTAIAKYNFRRYVEKTGLEITDALTFQELDTHARAGALNAIYTWYLDAADWPCYARFPATDYIPSAEELDMRVPQHSKWNNDGTRKTYAQLEMEGLLDDAPTLRETLPDIPPGWEAIMLDRRRRFPEQYARKQVGRDQL